MTVQAVVDLVEGHSRLVDRQPKNLYRQICCECVGQLMLCGQRASAWVMSSPGKSSCL